MPFQATKLILMGTPGRAFPTTVIDRPNAITELNAEFDPDADFNAEFDPDFDLAAEHDATPVDCPAEFDPDADFNAEHDPDFNLDAEYDVED